jgi:hypothetical protein
MIIYFAGAEGGDSKEIIETGLVKNGFFSYYYLRNNNVKNTYFRNHRDFFKSIIIDSGAHTFFSERAAEGLSVSNLKKKTKTKGTADEYWQKYKVWLLDNKKYYDYYVELDIGEIVGQEKVNEWRQELKALGIFNRCITVVHPNVVSFEDYLKMLDETESKYVALEGDRDNRPRLNYNKYLKPAIEKGVKIHCFAMTKDDVYGMFPFYSVDSTSWKAGAQYGITKVKTNQGMKLVRFTDKGHLLSVNSNNIAHTLGDSKKISRIERYTLSIQAYQDIESYYTRLWERRGVKYT